MGGWLDGIPVVGDVEDAAGTVGTGLLDAPADVVNELDGNSSNDDNTGWAGTVPDQFDSEAGGGFLDVWAGGTADLIFERPNEGANFWFGGIGADANSDDPVGSDGIDLPGGSASEAANDGLNYAADAANDAADWTLSQLWESTAGKLLLVLAVVYVVGQLVDIDAGGAAG